MESVTLLGSTTSSSQRTEFSDGAELPVMVELAGSEVTCG